MGPLGSLGGVLFMSLDSLPAGVSEPVASSAVKATCADNDSALCADVFLSVKEAAAILHISYGSVLAAVHAGSLVAYKFGPHGGTYRISGAPIYRTILLHPGPGKASTARRRERTGGTFQKLDGERLLRAWRKQGVLADRGEEAAE